MFMLYAVAAGLVGGLLSRGRLMGLASLTLVWAPVMVLGFVAQIVLFTGPVTERIGDLGPVLYVGSTATVLVAVARNWRVRGMPVVLAGALSNFAAIVSNGGYMPASPGALAALGKAEATVYSNSAVVPQPNLPWLTDIFAMPRGMPMANIFSVGDVLIAMGIAAVIVLAMHAKAAAPEVETPIEEAAPPASEPDGVLPEREPLPRTGTWRQSLLPSPRPGALLAASGPGLAMAGGGVGPSGGSLALRLQGSTSPMSTSRVSAAVALPPAVEEIEWPEAWLRDPVPSSSERPARRNGRNEPIAPSSWAGLGGGAEAAPDAPPVGTWRRNVLSAPAGACVA